MLKGVIIFFAVMLSGCGASNEGLSCGKAALKKPGSPERTIVRLFFDARGIEVVYPDGKTRMAASFSRRNQTFFERICMRSYDKKSKS